MKENQSIRMKKVTNLLAGTKTSGLIFNKKTLKYESGTALRHNACITCDLLVYCVP